MMSFSRSACSAACRSPRSDSATACRAPSQNVRPTTAACATRRRSNGSSESRRAASSAWTVSGRSLAVPDPSSLRWRTISSANSGLPSARSATAAISSSLAASSPCSSSAISSRVSVSSSGSRNTVVALRRAPPQLARRSSSSSRARQTSSSGARTHCVRYSIRSSIPWSAQWMSSHASTSGWSRAIPSTQDRTAAKNTSRVRWASA